MTVSPPRWRAPKGSADAVLQRLFPEADPYAADPTGWVRAKLGEHLWSKQRVITESVRDNRHTAVHSSHDTGKSYNASRLVAWWLSVHPLGEAFAVTTAPTQSQIEAILWREIRKAHRKGDLPGRTTLDCEWYMGADELVAFGRKPADTADPEEAKARFTGIHAKYVLVILDEASGIPGWLWDAAEALATNEHSRILAIGNPDDPSSEFAKVCEPGSGWNTIHISAYDTPAFTGEVVPADLLDLLVSETWVAERLKRWGKDSPMFQSKVLGVFPELGDDTLISPRWIRAAQERDLPGLEQGAFGCDIARKGADETVVYRNRGGVVRLAHSSSKKDTMRTSGDIAALIKAKRDEVPAIVDSIGVGAGVYDRLTELGLPVAAFVASEKAYQPDRFVNRRAEQWWAVREAFESGVVDVDARDDVLASQLGSIKYKRDSKGRIKIESKDDMAKRGLPSPDRADALMMSFAPAEVWPKDIMRTRTKPKDLTSDLLDRKM